MSGGLQCLNDLYLFIGGWGLGGKLCAILSFDLNFQEFVSHEFNNNFGI